MIPSDIAGLKLWLKADSLVLSDGDPVVTWSDSSGLGNDATQGTAGFRPTFQTNEIFGLPVVRFDGTDDYLAGSVSNSGTSCTVLMVVKRISWKGDSGQASFFLSSTTDDWNDARNFVLAYSPSTSDFKSYRNGALSAAVHPGNGIPYIYTSKFDGANNTVYLNGSAQTPVSSSGSFGFDSYYVGARYRSSGPIERDNSDVGELIAYDSALSDGDRAGIESYLDTRWITGPPAPLSPSFRINKLRPAFFKPGLAR